MAGNPLKQNAILADKNLTGKNLTGNQLKLIACLAMLADHAAKGFSLRGPAFIIMSGLIGRIAFPIFCVMLAEGFFYTRNRKRYLVRILLLALASEIPFDLLFRNTLFYWDHQNTCFTLFLGLLLFLVLEKIRENGQADYRMSAALQILSIFAFSSAAVLLRTDYDASGILALTALYYGWRTKKGTAAITACLFLNIYQFQNLGAFLALIPLSLYSGSRGSRRAAARNLFYIFYPAHLLVLYFLSR